MTTMFKYVMLQTKHHEFVATVVIPAFEETPDVLMWGDRFFARVWGKCGPVTQGAVFTEVFCVAVVPIPMIAKNDGTDVKGG